MIEKKCFALARAECANNRGGLCVPRGRPCFAFIPPTQACTWFMRAVVLLDQELSAVLGDMERAGKLQSIKCCERCGKPFAPASNRQIYCKPCGECVRRERASARQRERRICHALERAKHF